MSTVAFGHRSPQTFNGMPIYITHDAPKMKLSADCPVTPGFRVEMDAWLLSFFGTTNLLKDGETIVNNMAGTLHMNPRTYERLRAAPQPTKGQTP